VERVEAVKALPFCAFILTTFDGGARGHSATVLMEPGEFTEENLRLLFEALSSKYPGADLDNHVLSVSVYTDVKQLYSLAVGYNMSGGDSRDRDNGGLQRAQYWRSTNNEFFLFNPAPGDFKNKTVIIRGQERRQ
jgi:hypothetical protein